MDTVQLHVFTVEENTPPVGVQLLVEDGYHFHMLGFYNDILEKWETRSGWRNVHKNDKWCRIPDFTETKYKA